MLTDLSKRKSMEEGPRSFAAEAVVDRNCCRTFGRADSSSLVGLPIYTPMGKGITKLNDCDF